MGSAEAMVAEAFHDAADLWRGSQGATASAQYAKQAEYWPAGGDLTLVADLGADGRVFEDFHLDTSAVETFRVRQQL